MATQWHNSVPDYYIKLHYYIYFWFLKLFRFSFFKKKEYIRWHYTIDGFFLSLICTSRFNCVQFPVFCGDIFFVICFLLSVDIYIVISSVRFMQAWMTAQSPLCGFWHNLFYICSKWDEMKLWLYWSQHNVNSIFLLLLKSLLRKEAKC